MPSFNEIASKNLMRRLGGPETPIVIDVCTDDDFVLDPRLIPTSMRCPAAEIDRLLPEMEGRAVVVVCQKGRKLSHGAAALLQAQGIAAEVLSGGIWAWRDAELPLIPAELLNRIGAPGSRWVTRNRPRIDRIASPWLIRRFIDPKAQILFVPTAEVAAVADRFNATPFDVDSAEFSHHDDTCTFDSLIHGFNLAHAPLNRLATIVRAADMGHPEHAPQAAGLLAVSVGMSRLHKSDQEQLSATLPIYDALYRWARDGYAETHEHPTGSQQ